MGREHQVDKIGQKMAKVPRGNEYKCEVRETKREKTDSKKVKKPKLKARYSDNLCAQGSTNAQPLTYVSSLE